MLKKTNQIDNETTNQKKNETETASVHNFNVSLSFIFNLIFAEDQLNILTNNCLKKLLICFFFSFLE